MRTIIHGTIGWEALPFIALIGAAYLWIVSRFVRTEHKVEEPSVVKKVA